MAINLISPGVKVTEADLVKTIPPTGGSIGGTAGAFRWGPIEEAVLVSNEADLVAKFAVPGSNTVTVSGITYATDFLNASNYLSYSSGMRVVRAANNTVAKNSTAAGSGFLVKNDTAYTEWLLAGGNDATSPWIAKFAGEMGNSLRVSTCPSANAWSSKLTATEIVLTQDSTTVIVTGGQLTTDTPSPLVAGETVTIFKQGSIWIPNLVVQSVINATAFRLATKWTGSTVSANNISRSWQYRSAFDAAPAHSPAALAKGARNDEMHIVVVDEDGVFSGAPGTILEKYAAVSKGLDARSTDGGSNFYRDVINSRSKYIRWYGKDSQGTNWDTILKIPGGTATDYTTVSTPRTFSFNNGADGLPADGDRINAFAVLANKEQVDISLIPVGAASAAVINAVIGQVADVRKDVVVCFSPLRTHVVNNAGNETTSINTFAEGITRSTYAVMDANWKYQYNKFSDSYLYVPCNADTAGCMARTDFEQAPWFSPAGYARGVIKNSVRLAWNPTEPNRDELYKNGINPVITQTGRGTVLFGDKTFSTTVGSFSRVNVRRLFIELEKRIANFAGNLLFEQNDVATRASFVDTVEPYLRSVQSQRGMSQFAVVCNDSNNTEDVVNANGFVADIYIRPTTSINFIQLNFVSVAGASSFSVIGG